MTEKEFAPHQQRVIDEKKELDIKIEALGTFIHGDGDGAYGKIYRTLLEAERMRLVRQLGVMVEYSEILGERIENF